MRDFENDERWKNKEKEISMALKNLQFRLVAFKIFYDSRVNLKMLINKINKKYSRFIRKTVGAEDQNLIFYVTKLAKEKGILLDRKKEKTLYFKTFDAYFESSYD